MAKRSIIEIDEKKCNGCGQCIPNCPEGALQVIDGKARLVSDLFCDGLGACIGHCPQGAIKVLTREARDYDERQVMANIVKQGKNVIKAHLLHLAEHGEKAYLKTAREFLREKGIDDPLEEKAPVHHHATGGCPGSRIMELNPREPEKSAKVSGASPSRLRQWPVQIMLVPVNAPYFSGADLLISADCVSCAYADFHEDLLKGKILLVGCPKLDNLEVYAQKIEAIIAANELKSVTYAHMEVPCCYGLIEVIRSAIQRSGKKIPFKDVTISVKGEKV